MSIIEKIFGTHSERELKSVYAIADKIESLRPQMQALSDVYKRQVHTFTYL